MKKCALWLLLALLECGCVRKAPRELVIKVVDAKSNKELKSISILIENKYISDTNAQGIAVVAIEQEPKQHLNLSLVDKDKYSDYLPKVTTIEVPYSYFPDKWETIIKLAKIPAVEDAQIDINTEDQFVSETAPRVIAEKELEAEKPIPIPTELAKKTPQPTPTSASKETSLPAEKNNSDISLADTHSSTGALSVGKTGFGEITLPKLANLKAKSIENIKVSVTSNGQPLDSAKIYLGRAAHRSFNYVGSSNESGQLTFSIPSLIKGELLLIEHSCCKGQLRPLLGGSSGTMSVDLVGGKSNIYGLKNDNYGFARIASLLEVYSDNKRLDTAGPAGLVIVASDKPGDIVLKSTETVPSEIKITSADAFVIGYAGSKKNILPAVALVDMSAGQINASNSYVLWRRFKREFISSLMQQKIIRPVTEGETERLIEATQNSSENLLSKGWQFSLINPDFDFAIFFDFRDSNLTVSMVERNGTLLSKKTLALNADEKDFMPETVAKKMASEMIKNLPYEGTVLAKQGENKLLVNLGERQLIKKGDIFEVFTWKDGKPQNERNSKIGDAVVESTGADDAVLVLNNNAILENCVGARVRKRTNVAASSSLAKQTKDDKNTDL